MKAEHARKIAEKVAAAKKIEKRTAEFNRQKEIADKAAPLVDDVLTKMRKEIQKNAKDGYNTASFSVPKNEVELESHQRAIAILSRDGYRFKSDSFHDDDGNWMYDVCYARW